MTKAAQIISRSENVTERWLILWLQKTRFKIRLCLQTQICDNLKVFGTSWRRRVYLHLRSLSLSFFGRQACKSYNMLTTGDAIKDWINNNLCILHHVCSHITIKMTVLLFTRTLDTNVVSICFACSSLNHCGSWRLDPHWFFHTERNRDKGVGVGAGPKSETEQWETVGPNPVQVQV